ncbi:DUF2771 domain-containing protein [Streptomyces sp. WAC05374]|uniref:DUF2771 domain-containing protein n=1 Tax=Streptomyces sp. WAC05374 TaxID=2487420 RepID=UPI000F86DD00|nr:DUF2771 domain-containing protein [Streptomyces sp. WAC05374]RST14007.1 DUF2771 domain-containing protein [Streptomyces sp. WAC05374]TDF47245.1 DUF2771 domain-containing protein [Streptomyces sp. WAC05374]TDF57503.1 DUF2771 domain-containing protein [Streptomyces sp. WAC05374]TDF61608.1 DUF2771 domain-containing protein [Streptomyces sp. WAC05374]
MTVAFFSGKARRAGVALGAVSAGLLVLSACDKPTPLATVTVGSDSVNAEATCYNDGKAIKESQIQSCLNKKAEKTITVSADDRVRFGVDPEIAENGWTLFIGGQQAEQEPYKKTYRSIPASAFLSSQTGETSNTAQISIVETSGKKLTGIWHFELKKES